MLVKSSPMPIRFGMSPGSYDSSAEFARDLRSHFDHAKISRFQPLEYPGINTLLFLLDQPKVKKHICNENYQTIKSTLHKILIQAPTTSGTKEEKKRKLNALIEKSSIQFMAENGYNKDPLSMFKEILKTMVVANEFKDAGHPELVSKMQSLSRLSGNINRNTDIQAPLKADTFERSVSIANSTQNLTEEEIIRNFEKFEKLIREKIKGQEVALTSLLRWLELACISPSRAFDKRVQEKKPRLIALLAGPSGVGKTETIKYVTKTFGNREIIWIPGGEYNDEIKNNKIMGSAQGYAGNEDRTVADDIIEACERAKAAGNEPPIILIDELDKANSQFFTIWNNVFDEGRLVRNGYHDSKNNIDIPPKIVDFTGIDIFCTANFAQEAIRKKLAKKSEIDNIDMQEMVEAIKHDAKRKDVRPDFWGRFNAVIPYRSLTPKAVAEISDGKINETTAYYYDKYGVHLEIAPEVQQLLLKEGVSPDEGCRKLDNVITSIVDGGALSAIRDLKLAHQDKKTLGKPSNGKIEVFLKDGQVESKYS